MSDFNFQIFRQLPEDPDFPNGVGQLFEFEHPNAGTVGAHLETLVQADEQSIFNVYGSDPKTPLFKFQGHWNGNPALAQ